jgi:hypothetical protein
MKTKPRADPIERQIESAFRPGTFIRDGECFSFVSGLEEVTAKPSPLAPSRCMKSSLRGCHVKADELDDSSGSFGQFAQNLICRWIKSRQAAGRQPRMVKELDLFESNHGCGLNGCSGSHPEWRCNTTLHGSRIGA